MAPPVCELTVHGEHAQHPGIFSGGGGFGWMMNSSIPATDYPGELGIGIVEVCGGSGWRESTRGEAGVRESI